MFLICDVQKHFRFNPRRKLSTASMVLQMALALLAAHLDAAIARHTPQEERLLCVLLGSWARLVGPV